MGGERSCLLLLVEPKEDIKTEKYLMDLSPLVYREMLKEIYDDNDDIDFKSKLPVWTPSEFPKLKELYEDLVEWYMEYLRDTLEKNQKYLIMICRNSAGWPQDIEIIPIPGTYLDSNFQETSFKYHYISLPG